MGPFFVQLAFQENFFKCGAGIVTVSGRYRDALCQLIEGNWDSAQEILVKILKDIWPGDGPSEARASAALLGCRIVLPRLFFPVDFR